jgi:chaperonin GroEL (HSP60 family)
MPFSYAHTLILTNTVYIFFIHTLIRTLAENSGCDPTTAMHALHLSHEKPNTASMGFDLDLCGPGDALVEGKEVYDLLATKVRT